VITGSHDTTIRLWDLRKGATMATLTNHKKSVRALVGHPTEHTFASAGADNIKKFKLPNVSGGSAGGGWQVQELARRV
jgi:pleiotropic regulator 1